MKAVHVSPDILWAVLIQNGDLLPKQLQHMTDCAGCQELLAQINDAITGLPADAAA